MNVNLLVESRVGDRGSDGRRGKHEVVEVVVMIAGGIWLVTALVPVVTGMVVKLLRYFVEVFSSGEQVFW